MYIVQTVLLVWNSFIYVYMHGPHDIKHVKLRVHDLMTYEDKKMVDYIGI